MVMKIANNPIKIYALGGLGEVGKNTYCIESERHLIIIDAGVKFPEDDLVGVDYVIPNYTHLKNNQGKIRALFITHGHEDHIGAIPFLVKAIKVPVIYAPRLAAALIRQKLEEKKCKEKVNIIEYDENSNIVAGEFNVSFFRVTHSIPDSFGICVDTSEGRIVTTGDFKIDLTPVGPDIQIAKMADIGESGVDLLLADSTNAEKEGWTPSEKNVINSINEIFDKAPGRLIISTFSSNVSRIQQIVESTILHHRKLVVVGRSMVNTLEYARKFGYIKIPTAILRTVETMHDCKDSEMVILCTGSQGEPMAALSRIANGTFKNLHIIPGDTVVFSSSPIPGNGTSINKVVNLLTRLGADVITNSVFSDIHSSGHPSRKELQLNLKLFNPKYFMPAHGEYHMLKLHADLAKNIGIPPENIFVLGNGDTLVLNNHKITDGERIIADDVYIDGNDINGVSTAVIRDRKILQDDGMVSVLICLDSKSNKLAAAPKVITCGFVSNGAAESHLTRHASIQVQEALNNLLQTTNKVTFGDIKNTIRSVVSKYYFRKTQRNPMIIPLIMNYNN
ncbi:MAG: ribonuclease J [Mollicutes bacterium]|nr:ribonuclease J [Mollicutes bacterium]MDY4980143.1 ribonuclease J [Candidatus Onthovivens sp.]